MTGRDLKALVKDMEYRGLLDKEICSFDYDEDMLCNFVILHKNDEENVMGEYYWTGTQFEYSEFHAL